MKLVRTFFMHALTFISLANFTIDLRCVAGPCVLVPVPSLKLGLRVTTGVTRLQNLNGAPD